jgi:hypothetical protein
VEQHACHVAIFDLRDASIARRDKCSGDKFKRIQRDCNDTSNVLHRSAVWRIRPASVVIGERLVS